MKNCTKCHIIQPFENFHKNPHQKSGLCCVCKTCSRKYTQMRYQRDKDRLKQINALYGKTGRYGITLDEYNSLFIRQNGKCAICRQEKTNQKSTTRFCIDHDHKTGKVRGLLCHKCNKGLGNFLDDNLLLTNAISYLKGGYNACLPSH